MGQQELADWLLKQCDDRHLTATDASRRAGVAPNTISEIVNGTKPGLSRLTRLAAYFGVPTEYLLQMVGQLPAPPTPQRQQELSDIFRMLSTLPDGPVRDEAMANIRAIARDAVQRSRKLHNDTETMRLPQT